MDNLHHSLRTLFSTPFCPNCTTLFDAEQYDHVDERARCSHCGTVYRIPDGHVPDNPDDDIDDVRPDTAHIVQPHEPGYWPAQATGFRLIRLLERYLALTQTCGRLVSVAQTSTERDFFRAEHDRLYRLTCRIARQVARSNGYAILRALSDDSPAYRVVIQNQPIALSGGSCIKETPQFLTLEQLRADAERLAEAEMRATAGATYELYARQFSTACARAINKLDPDLRRYAVKIANDHGYIAGEDERYADFGPGLCSLTGIDEHYCHCGRHP